MEKSFRKKTCLHFYLENTQFVLLLNIINISLLNQEIKIFQSVAQV